MSKIPKAKFVPTACTYLNNVRDLRTNEDTPGAQNVQNLFGAMEWSDDGGHHDSWLKDRDKLLKLTESYS